MTTHPISTTAIVTSPPKAGPHVSWTLQPVHLREPRENELLVRILATGVCHTDLVLSMASPDRSLYPKVLGHEGAGVVERIGAGVTHAKPGDYVLLSIDSCGEKNGFCYNCSRQRPGYCPEFTQRNIMSVAGVYDVDGVQAAGGFFGQSSFSGMALVQARSAVNVTGLVGSEEELRLFAPFGCGFQTGAGAVAEAVRVGERDVVLVAGLGGVGMLAVMAAKIRGARVVIGVDRVKGRLEIAKSVGATHVIDTSGLEDLTEGLVEKVKEIVPGGPNVSVETTGVLPIVSAAVKMLHPGGQAVLVGIMQGKLDLDLEDLLALGKTVRGVVEGEVSPPIFVPQLIQWYRTGKLPIEKLVKFYPVADFEKALVDMHTGVTIKPILTW